MFLFAFSLFMVFYHRAPAALALFLIRLILKGLYT